MHWCVNIYYVSHNFVRIRLTPWWSYVTLSFKSFLGVKAYLHWGYHRCWCVISTGGHDIVLYYICDQYMYLLICDFITLFCFSWPRKGAFFLSILNQLGFIYVGEYVFIHMWISDKLLVCQLTVFAVYLLSFWQKADL